MILSLGDVISQFSLALDAVEATLAGATPYHSKRVALLSLAIGKHFKFSDNQLFDLGCCALMHDNALTEYILSERPESNRIYLKTHCELGEKNLSSFPFMGNTEGFILYHHEQPDGKGPFMKKAGEYPLEAAIIQLADQIDVRFHLQRSGADALEKIRTHLAQRSGTFYSTNAADAAFHLLDRAFLEQFRDDVIINNLKEALPDAVHEITDQQAIAFSRITAKIIDYKSAFTREHSMQIANKAWYMADVYEYSTGQKTALYLAAAFHDIGKLFIPTAILEKTGRLTDEEFEIIKSHALYSYQVLSSIRGFEDITQWACNHHEKLDGTGYPFHKEAKDLDFNSRLLTCLDIYQAVSEARPYHTARSHSDTMKILFQMAQGGVIDSSICNDLDKALMQLENGFAPYPSV